MPPKYSIKTRGIYKQGSSAPHRLSRTKIDLSVECPRCFFLDQRLGVKRPQFPAFTLNSAVDELLKREFDIHRTDITRHPLMEEYGIDAVPFQHEKMEEWRHNFTGISTLHKPTNFEVFGAIDDVWVNPKGELYIVDYKSTSKNETPNLDGFWQQGFKRQMEVYQWLFRQNGFKVSNIGYFVYANGKKDEKAFDKKLNFDVTVISYDSNDSWVEDALVVAKGYLESDNLPEIGEFCEYCPYRDAAGNQIRKHLTDTGKINTKTSSSKKGTDPQETLL